MPYKVAKKSNGFKVCKKNGGKCFSKKPLTKKKAISQLKAIEANTHNESHKFTKKSVRDIILEEAEHFIPKKKCENCDNDANESGLCGNCESKERASQVDESANPELDSLASELDQARKVMHRNDPVEIRSYLENRGNSLQEYIMMLKQKIQTIDPKYFTHCGYCGRMESDLGPNRTCHTCENELYGD